MHIVFPRTNKKLLKSKEFEDNHVEFYPAKSLEPGTDELDFNTQHFRGACVGGIIMINGSKHYYENNTLYDYYSGKKINDKKPLSY